jgi:hypothetical protein
MIALLLAAQISAAALPRGLPLETIPPPRGELIRVLPLPASRAASCFGGAGRVEVGFAEPTALYRQGDRPAVGLRKWADYPTGSFCRVEAQR